MRKLQTFFALLGFLFAAGAPAQEEATAFELRFSNPGARSLGFGGAFVALADDATAAFANPAGLTQLLEPELTLEIRGQSVTSPPDSPAIDLSLGLSTQAFIAFVYPWKNISLAVYRNGFANFESNAQIIGSLPDGGSFDVQTANELEIVNTGISVSYRLNENLSLGAGVYEWQGIFESVTAETRTGPDPRTAILRFRQTTTNEDTDIGFNAGFLWRLAKRWRLGGVLRQGPELALRSVERIGPVTQPLPSLPARELDSRIHFPSVLGLGLAFKPKNEKLTLSFEWDFVRYSNVLDSLAGEPDRGNFDLDDAHEIHLGLEYVITASRPVIALRLGGWIDPDHRLRYLGADPVDRVIFQGGRDESHLAAGLGLAFKRLKLDLAVDDSDSIFAGSFSAIYSF